MVGEPEGLVEDSNSLDPKALGFMCGLEIHQQLNSGKLHSRQPSMLYELGIEAVPPNWNRVERKLNATSGESGAIDVAARFEQRRKRSFVYIQCPNSGLIELDEAPPSGLDDEALDIAMTIAKLLEIHPVEVLQTMRKQVVDGSNTSGFQRTTLIGTSGKILEVIGMIGQVAPVDISVLVTGESGTGKEVMARAIHKHSKRSSLPMVTVNCGAIPEGIIESELFGHKKGSFTGASDDRKGYFEEANKGTIFLDEIGEAPLETQVKLLRVLEPGEYMRVGESKVRYTDVRVIAATNKNLAELVTKNQFRQDLFYRLKTVMLHVPSLRDRVEDINPLVERFALEFTRSNEILYRGFMPEAIRIMKQYNWPGNIRELKNFVEKIMVLEKGERK